MKRIVLLLASLVCFAANAKITTADCLKRGGGGFVFTADTLIRQDLERLGEKLQYDKTQLKLLYEEKVDPAFADYLARQDILNGRYKREPLNKIRQKYINDNVRNLVVEISYFTQQNKKITFLGSTFIRDNDCFVTSAPEKYLLIKREF